MDLVVSAEKVEQPPLLPNDNNELHVAVSSLSIGGAERIVIDWATRIYPRWKTNLIVLRDREKEWPVPSFIRVMRLHNKQRIEQLRSVGKKIAASNNPICVCHLLNKKERDALAESGVYAIPVLHNAKAGWLEDVSCISGAPYAIAVSDACARDLRENGWDGPVSVIRHIPPLKKFAPDARERFRKSWNVPQNATVIGMVGAVKPQKNYLFALRVLKTLLKYRDAYLVIIGGPVNKENGRASWEEVVGEVHSLGLRSKVAMPGFIPNAALCLPAFDVILNTSRYEGLSIATLEALIHGLPVVASKVGGQGELGGDALILIPEGASVEQWVSALEKSFYKKFSRPKWASFSAHKLWTLASLAKPVATNGKILFVTANLNSGGAQRSLVNLSKSLKGKLQLKIVVAGNTTTSYFYEELKKANVKVMRAADSWDAFSYSENIVREICQEQIGTVCFWNVDARVKLLLVKTLGFSEVRFIDVSPGDYLFDEMGSTTEFQQMISFTKSDYYNRLDKLVTKYHGLGPRECCGKTVVIQNGVPKPPNVKTDYAIRGAPRIVVNGRIAPSKFILEIIAAAKLLWEKIPLAELHFFGAAEHYHRDYARAVFELAEPEIGKRIFFHGLNFEVVSELADFDGCVVLGQNQGCPNSLLEALSVGLPAIANDDGGAREQVAHRRTGFLIKNRDPKELADALLKILTDRRLAQELGLAGRAHVETQFSMEEMCKKYTSLFGTQALEVNTFWERVCRKTSSWFSKQTTIEKEELQWR